MANPQYYIAVFGDPDSPDKDLVESGVYRPSSDPLPVRTGDILLLYCTGGYKGHEMEVPGIGVALAVDDKAIRYRYLPFLVPISKNDLDRTLDETDLHKFRNIRFNTFRLLEISKTSFARSVASKAIAWP